MAVVVFEKLSESFVWLMLSEPEQEGAAWHSPGVCKAAAGSGPQGPQRGPVLHRLPGHQSAAVPVPAGGSLVMLMTYSNALHLIMS